MTIDIKTSGHEFNKTNLVTTKQGYDLLVCKYCGMKAKRQVLDGSAYVGNNYSHQRANNCPKAPETPKPKKVRVTQCQAIGKVFANLTPGSIHEVIEPPEGQSSNRGVWVAGVGEPVKLLTGEYEEA